MSNQTLPLIVGHDKDGKDISFDLATLPHLLIGGCTGSGKSVCIKSILLQLMRAKTPDEVRFIVYDAKRIEFMSRGNWPYLLQPVIVETGSFLLALEELRKEFDELVQALRNGAPVPRIVVVADEYSDLMVADGDKANSLLADMLALGRSAGVHFIFATSRADEVVMSQPLRCGFPGRIAFKVAFEEDSRIIIGENGADRLNGRGDFLFRDATGLHCGQAPYIPDEDFERLCTH